MAPKELFCKIVASKHGISMVCTIVKIDKIENFKITIVQTNKILNKKLVIGDTSCKKSIFRNIGFPHIKSMFGKSVKNH